MKFDPTLYLVTDSTGRTDDDFLSILEKALTGGVTLVQLREKERGGGEYLRLARLTKAVCDRYRVPLIIDDRADIAMAADAAGVHVGQSDLPVCEVRKLLGEDKIVGATAKTVAQIRKTHVFKKHTWNKKLLEAILGSADPAHKLFAVDRHTVQRIRDRCFQIQIAIRCTETPQIV